MNLTAVRGKDRIPHLLLGLIDCGTRVGLALHELASKRSRTIWLELLVLIRRGRRAKNCRLPITWSRISLLGDRNLSKNAASAGSIPSSVVAS